jgi:HSP20 family protein
MSRQQQAPQELINEFVDMLGPSFRNVLGGGNRPVPFAAPVRQQGKFPVDIVNEENVIYIYAEIPGVTKESIDVDFYNNKLTISADKNRNYESPEMSEIKFGRCERTLTLPICVTRKDAVAVSYNNGILKIKINKLVEEENKFSVKIGE